MSLNAKPIKADFFWPLATLAVVGMALVMVAVLALVRQMDAASKAREQTVVENGVIGWTNEVAHMVVTQVVWDEAVRNLDNRFDPEWAKGNVGEFFYSVDGFERSFVLDDDNRPIYAADKGVTISPDSYARFAPATQSLVSKVRAGETLRGPLSKASDLSALLDKPIQASTIAVVDDEPFMLSATLVQPDFGESLPAGSRSAIVVTGMPMDDAFLARFAKRFMLTNLHIHQGDATNEADDAHATLRNERGEAVATMDWTPQAPGQALFSRLVLPILAALCGLGLIALWLYRRSSRMAQGLIASEARAAHLAYHDALTGLPNRVLFFDRLAHAMEQMRRDGQKIAVHCIDLDRFKDVNDTFGHHVGNELIQAAARRLAAQCRGADTFARLSGDEFAIVQSNATVASAAALAARLVEIMAQPVDLSAGRVFVGCSIGVTLVIDDHLEPAEALRQADLALYRAKQNGKVQFCFFEIEMDAAIKTRRALEADLRGALARGELGMAYQPQVNKNGVMTGVEGLVRWIHPERGYVSPAFFVPIAEECGLIIDLGMFTLRRAFEDSRRWKGLKVAVNVSANQLRLKDFVPRIVELVEELQVDPKRFELEITEGILLGDDPNTHETLKRLRHMGFSIALDDFGTGYSSLSYLQRYPINKIKIDRSFIANLGVDTESEAVVGAIIKLARALKLSVIAEGVETTDQRARLAAAGCSEVQGYLFSRPVGADEIEVMRRRRSLRVAPEAA